MNLPSPQTLIDNLRGLRDASVRRIDDRLRRLPGFRSVRTATLTASVIVLGVVVLFWALASSAAPAAVLPDTAESETQWKCRTCDVAFRLTAHAADQAQRRSGAPMPIHCEACDVRDAWRAARCTAHELLYFVADVPGARGVCPRCHPQAPEDPQDESGATPPGSAPSGSSQQSDDGAAPAVRRVPVA
ncbi:MAG: hypothetical protein V3T70_11040 [Phycisphaerae bacterium]